MFNNAACYAELEMYTKAKETLEILVQVKTISQKLRMMVERLERFV